MRIKPFRALCPPRELAASVASPPYDVVDTREAKALAADNPMSFLHVIRPEIDLPEGTDPYAEEVYAKAAENFRAFQEKGYLCMDQAPCLYVYQLTMGEHVQTGIVAGCHIDDYEQDVIRKHEKTRKRTEDDRTRHVEVLNANAGPVFLTYRDEATIDALVAEAKTAPPLYTFSDETRVQHTLWRVASADAWIRSFAAIPYAYVADGHHRSASAARVGAQRRAANPNHRGEEEYNWFMAVLFPASQLNILSYNRCVRDLNGLTPEQFLEVARIAFDVTEAAPPSPKAPGQISMYMAGNWYGLHWDARAASEPVDALDVAALQERLLGPSLGIDDPRSNERISFIGGIKGPEELVRRVDDGRAAVAFSLYPTSVDQLMQIADARQIMPPKSTWFEPKLRSGLVVHLLEG